MPPQVAKWQETGNPRQEQSGEDMMADVETRTGWTQRPWLMAAVGAIAGMLFHVLSDGLGWHPRPNTSTLLRIAAATAVGVGSVSFMLTAERRRLTWAVGFALLWGAVMALVGYFSASYTGRGDIFGFPFFAGLLAVAIAAPLFQTVRDEGAWRLPYSSVHRYAWTDAIIGGAGLAFTLLTFLLAYLLANLFDAIGISLLKDLLDEELAWWMMAGAAFGAATAVLRERDALLGTLQKLVMVVFSVLAPVLAIALAIFLIAIPATGFAGLWKSGLPETPLLLSAAAFAVVMLNAIIGDSPDDRGKGRMWRATEYILLLSVLPLGVLALVSMGMRVGQYGWTPERLWGVIACLVAAAYGVAGWYAFIRARADFDGSIRNSQKRLAVGLCGLALFLALPIVDFGTISTASQMARLKQRPPAEFDWGAMAFDFGRSGRKALERLRDGGDKELADLAKRALDAKSRYDLYDLGQHAEEARAIEQFVTVRSPDIQMTDELRRHLVAMGGCRDGLPCILVRIDDRHLALLRAPKGRGQVYSSVIDLDHLADPDEALAIEMETPPAPETQDISKATIEVRTIERRQLFVDGKPVGEPFE